MMDPVMGRRADEMEPLGEAHHGRAGRPVGHIVKMHSEQHAGGIREPDDHQRVGHGRDREQRGHKRAKSEQYRARRRAQRGMFEETIAMDMMRMGGMLAR